MAAQFYYQVSALPMVRFGEPAPLSLAAFGDFCRGQLPEAEAAALARVSLEPTGVPCCEVERRWQVWETYARNCLVRWRATRLGVDGAEFLRPDDDVFPGDRRRIEEIMSDPDPLNRERELDRLRWQRLDDLAVEHDFDLGALVLYALRLGLACKWAGRSEPAGRQVYERLLDATVGQAAAKRFASGMSIAT
jgi:hypothetical protein